MKYSCVELNDLPDEILLIIFKKLDNLEILYSIQDINERLNKIIYDQIFTSHLSFLKWSFNKCINKFSSDIILNRFCLQILPKIHTKIKWLDVESSFMKNILHAADYPNLNTLGLYNIEEETAKYLFTDEKLSSSIFKKQITKLIFSINSDTKTWSTMENICNIIFTVFLNLTNLIFYDASYKNHVRLSFDIPSPTFSSSSLLILNIKVQSFCICLHILDGRFEQLHTLYIQLANIFPPSKEIENQRKIPNLKCFGLYCVLATLYYNKLILPLLYRMTNLEKLSLDLSVFVNETFIDGNYLKKNILNHMLQLKQFTFDIRSSMLINNQMNLPSNEDIQRTFNDFQYTKIISCVDYFQEYKQGLCHIYSYPFLMNHYEGITNNFPDGLYPYVRVVSLYDEHPFEHDFFIRISQSFPFMEKLYINNLHAQNQKESYKLMNDESNLSIIKYDYLIELHIDYRTHHDYIEEFLCNMKTYLQNNILLDVHYKALQRVTYDFTRDSTRINCTKVNQLSLFGKVEYSKSCKDYFPLAIID
ncbi:unnamed protein product [Rotaria sordida]|uniref:F-box domain-containing protein n=2 Tax=Rotaria sordida TaxID=392033 RepID=A0A814IM02_9BILA|nr:unnamed protein product [Rotaria sordida]CAF3838103.1 unnamed protein product [Rotaria sordida]